MHLYTVCLVGFMWLIKYAADGISIALRNMFYGISILSIRSTIKSTLSHACIWLSLWIDRTFDEKVIGNTKTDVTHQKFYFLLRNTTVAATLALSHTIWLEDRSGIQSIASKNNPRWHCVLSSRYFFPIWNYSMTVQFLSIVFKPCEYNQFFSLSQILPRFTLIWAQSINFDEQIINWFGLQFQLYSKVLSPILMN